MKFILTAAVLLAAVHDDDAHTRRAGALVQVPLVGADAHVGGV